MCAKCKKCKWEDYECGVWSLEMTQYTTYRHTHTHAHTYIHTHIHIHAFIQKTYTYTYVHIHTFIQAHTYTHTQTHMHTRAHTLSLTCLAGSAQILYGVSADSKTIVIINSPAPLSSWIIVLNLGYFFCASFRPIWVIFWIN